MKRLRGPHAVENPSLSHAISGPTVKSLPPYSGEILMFFL